MTHGLDEMAGRRRVVVARVGNAEPTTRAELARLESELVPQLDQEVEHDLHRLLVRAEGEYLRAQV